MPVGFWLSKHKIVCVQPMCGMKHGEADRVFKTHIRDWTYKYCAQYAFCSDCAGGRKNELQNAIRYERWRKRLVHASLIVATVQYTTRAQHVFILALPKQARFIPVAYFAMFRIENLGGVSECKRCILEKKCGKPVPAGSGLFRPRGSMEAATRNDTSN